VYNLRAELSLSLFRLEFKVFVALLFWGWCLLSDSPDLRSSSS